MNPELHFILKFDQDELVLVQIIYFSAVMF